MRGAQAMCACMHARCWPACMRVQCCVPVLAMRTGAWCSVNPACTVASLALRAAPRTRLAWRVHSLSVHIQLVPRGSRASRQTCRVSLTTSGIAATSRTRAGWVATGTTKAKVGAQRAAQGATDVHRTDARAAAVAWQCAWVRAPARRTASRKHVAVGATLAGTGGQCACALSQHAASRGWPCAHACMRRHPGVVCLQLCKDASVPVQPCAVTIVPRWCDAAAPPSRSRQTVPRGSNLGRVAALTCSGRARALAVWLSDMR